MFRCSAASRRTSSFCARFVSWNSSTRTWTNLLPVGSEHVLERVEEVDGHHEQVVEVHSRRLMEALLVLGVDVADAMLYERLRVGRW